MSEKIISERLGRQLRVLAFMEARYQTTGPAKNLIEFACRAARKPKTALSAKITIVTFQRGKDPQPNDFVLACEKAGLEIHTIRERFPFDPSILPSIRKIMTHCKPDIIQSHAVKSHFLVRLTRIHEKCPWIAFHHGYTRTSQRAKLYNYLDRWSLRAASKVVTVCRPFASDLVGIGVRPKRIIIQHNSVNTFSPSSSKEILGVRRTLGISADTQILLCVGRLSKEKAQEDLIQAAAQLKTKYDRSKIRFILAGEGPEQQSLKDRARSLCVEDWFIFAGYLEDLGPYYTTASLLVMPSHSEGSPNALLEAMAAGLPIIATSVGGVREMVTHEREAILVEKENPAALARAIELILDDTDLRGHLGAAARRRSKAYSPDAYCNSIMSVYASCFACDMGSECSERECH